MAGYTRQSSFADGDTITAALFNDEYNQLVNAFNNSTGHDTSAKPTGQGYGKARKGPGVRGPIEAQVKEEPKEYKNNA